MQRKQVLFDIYKVVNVLFITISVAICSMLMLLDLPGVELLETNPNWLLIWLISWSIKRTFWQGAIAGLAIGWIYDGISLSFPSHVASFMFVGILTSSLQKQKYLGEDFISVAFIVFFMTICAESIYAWQYARHWQAIAEAFGKYQEVVIVSAIITSLWSPAFYYPFNLISEKIDRRMKAVKDWN